MLGALGIGCIGRENMFRFLETKRKRKKNAAPDVGLEPTTLRLRVSCSTD